MISHHQRSTVALLAIFLSTWLASGCGINNIPTYDEAVNGRWTDVQNQYKNRTDLIPDLIITVEGFAKQESDVVNELNATRTQILQMSISPASLTDRDAFDQYQQNQEALTTALQSLMTTVKDYPDLEFDQKFLTLQQQLESVENGIALARRNYRSAVQKYNIEIRTIPGRWWVRFIYPDMKSKASFPSPKKT